MFRQQYELKYPNRLCTCKWENDEQWDLCLCDSNLWVKKETLEETAKGVIEYLEKIHKPNEEDEISFLEKILKK